MLCLMCIFGAFFEATVKVVLTRPALTLVSTFGALFLQVELYLRFKRKYAAIQILQRCFESMKPFFVQKLRDRYTCCCIVHVQMIFLKEAVNHLWSQSFDLHGSCCMCSCPICLHHDWVVNHGCLASKNTIKSTSSLLECILCPLLPEHSFHSYQCLMGTCNACGLGKIQIYPREITE